MNFKKLENLKDQGIALLSPFIKEAVCDKDNGYSAVDGYQAAVICMNLGYYVKIKQRKDTLTGLDSNNSLTEEEKSFFKSFRIILEDQKTLISKSLTEFYLFISTKLEDKLVDKDHFLQALFHDPRQFPSNTKTTKV